MKHVSVMLNEAVDALKVRSGGIYVDGTLGRAGHSTEILRRTGGDAVLIGIDRDPIALKESGEKLAQFGNATVKLMHGNHGDIARLVKESGFEEVDGVLLDLGVSSPQLDEPERGFSFRADGPLDMRMDTTKGQTAADIVANSDEDLLVNIFRDFGEEPNARRIAKAIVRERVNNSFKTTLQLAEFVEKTIGRRGAHHPATRIFQALRMAVNDEIGELKRALDGGLGALKTGGRFAVITFESLTDRIVKHFFTEHEGREISLQAGGSKWEGKLPRVMRTPRGAVVPSELELENNPRSRSAKLRIAERI
jgi:16S rRNA (cytosine1402-N4)-methyltransferase